MSMGRFGNLDRPVVDGTGLSGKYDFLVEFRPGLGLDESEPDNYDSSGVGFRKALLEQTGLTLRSTKAQVPKLVIDRLDHASPN